MIGFINVFSGYVIRQQDEGVYITMDNVNDNVMGDERRSHHNLRVIFDAACRITAPFFGEKQEWEGQSHTMYARQTLRDAYPELSQQEVALLYSSVQRFHRARPAG